MCVVAPAEVLSRLDAASRLMLRSLEGAQCRSPDTWTTATDLGRLLDSSLPLVLPLTSPVPGQISPEALLRRRVNTYPEVLAELVGPPSRIGHDAELGYVAGECAVAALRRRDLRATCSMLFLATLCAPTLERPHIEALAHVLMETDKNGLAGLTANGVRRAGLSAAEAALSRDQLTLRFLAAAVQMLGTWGRRD